jgi:hypothetical protein
MPKKAKKTKKRIAKKAIEKKQPKKKVVKAVVIKPEAKPNPLADVDVLHEALGGDKELTLFFMAWISCGRNATRAYKKLHPEVTDGSARVLGSKLLTKINIPVILESYDLGFDTYFQQLKSGLNATKHVEGLKVEKGKIKKVLMEIPDHKTRDKYHTKLGKLLEIEKEAQTNVIQVNQNNNSIDNIQDDELDAFISR